MGHPHPTRCTMIFSMHLHRWLFHTSTMASGSITVNQLHTTELARFGRMLSEFGSRDLWIFYHTTVSTRLVIFLFILNFLHPSVWHIGLWKTLEKLSFMSEFFRFLFSVKFINHVRARCHSVAPNCAICLSSSMMSVVSQNFLHLNWCLFGSSYPSYRGMWLNPIFIVFLELLTFCGVWVTTIFD